MNMHTAVQPSIVTPRVGEIVDSLAARATAALRLVEASNEATVEAGETANDKPAFVPNWVPPASPKSGSKLGRSGTFALVLLGHALAFYVLTNLPRDVRDAVAEPLQVALLSETLNTAEPLPPPPPPRLQQFEVAVEPFVIDIAVADSSAITVAKAPEESSSSPSASTGAPKLVSTVDYIRQPAAKYPPAARALKQRGTVTLRVLVDAEGLAREVTVHRSSGHRLLDDAGRNAVFNALFHAYKENGRAIPVYVLIPIEFSPAIS